MDVYISQLLENKDLDKLINKYHCGLELIEYSISEYLDNSQAKLNEYYLDNYSHINIGIHAPFFDLIPATYDNEIRKVVMKRFQQVYDCAKVIDAKYIVYHTGFIKNTYFYETWLSNSLIFWQEFLADKDDSIKIFIENVFEDEIEHLVELVKIIDKSHFKICLDLGHANIQTKNIFEWLEKTKDYLGHLHIHNNDGNKDLHQSLLTGELDYLKILEYLNKENLDISLCLEMANEQALRESIDLIEEVIV